MSPMLANLGDVVTSTYSYPRKKAKEPFHPTIVVAIPIPLLKLSMHVSYSSYYVLQLLTSQPGLMFDHEPGVVSSGTVSKIPLPRKTDGWRRRSGGFE